MWWRGSLAGLAATLLACLFNVSAARALSQRDSNLLGTAPLAVSQPAANPAVAPGAATDSNNPNPNFTFDKRWFDSPGALPNTATQVASWDSSSALGYAQPPTTSAIPYGPTSLPAESGVNWELSPFAGFLKTGGGAGSQTVGGASGSVAFPIGHSFGLLSNFTAGSIGGNAIYLGGTNLYWRDPGLGLIGVAGQVGHIDIKSGVSFASAGAVFEGYYGRFTPFATVGASGAQSAATKGYGTIGLAYYPIDDWQLALIGYDYGGREGVEGGVEYLLPQQVNGIATSVALRGVIGSGGAATVLVRLKFMFGPTSENQKTASSLLGVGSNEFLLLVEAALPT